MAKFKVGDVVRYNDGIFNGIGVVREAEINGYFVDCFTMPPNKWHIAHGHFGDKFKEIIPDHTGWWFLEDELVREECVVEHKGFHIGDRVETIDCNGARAIGCTGTVVRIDLTFLFPIFVRYDKKYAIRGGNDLRGVLPQGSTSGMPESPKSFKIINHIIEKKNDEPIREYTDIEMRCIEKIRNLLTFQQG